MSRSLAIALMVGCQTDYLYVSVEGSDLSLTAAPADVRVTVYANRERVDFNYVARLEPKAPGGVPATDFVLVGESAAQLRVAIPTSTATWFADALIPITGEVRLPLFAGERAVVAANFANSDTDSVVLFGPGLVMAWVDNGGVEARVERDPDFLISRPEVVVADPAATNVRLTSRPNPLGYGPDLYAIGWIGGDGKARLRTESVTRTFPVRELTDADDLALGAPPKGPAYAFAVATREGQTLRVQTLDDSGLAGPLAATTIASGVIAIAGITVTRDDIIVGWRTNAGSQLALIDPSDGHVRNMVNVDGDLLAVSLTIDGSRLLTLQRRGVQLFQVSYFTNLIATTIETELGTTIVGGRPTLSTCVASWPELRADGSNRTDLRFAVLDGNGELLAEPHLLNVEEVGDHLSPTTACASPTRAYATFYERAAPSDPVARLRIRRVPNY